jgi:hypothetical protein
MGFSLGDEEEEDASLDADAESADGWVGEDDAAGWGSWGDTFSDVAVASGGAAAEQKEPEVGGLEATEAEASSPLKLQKQQQQQPYDSISGPALTTELNGVAVGSSPQLLASLSKNLPLSQIFLLVYCYCKQCSDLLIWRCPCFYFSRAQRALRRIYQCMTARISSRMKLMSKTTLTPTLRQETLNSFPVFSLKPSWAATSLCHHLQPPPTRAEVMYNSRESSVADLVINGAGDAGGLGRGRRERGRGRGLRCLLGWTRKRDRRRRGRGQN